MADLSAMYRKHTHREHILELPDTYIGSIETHPQEVYVVDGEKFVPQEAQINPGFYKLIDELLVNAHDQVIRLRQRKSESPVKAIDVEWKDGVLIIRNDGEGIDVEEHPEHKVYIPELIFSQLLTSTNYDKSEKKMVGGKNGYGVKLVNIFAKEMTITIVDAKRQRKYVQTFRNNMSVIEKPKITPYKLKSYVEVAWTPDLARFKWDVVPEGVLKLVERRVYDLAMTVGKEVKVKWNEKLMVSRDLKTYAAMYLPEKASIVADDPQAHWHVVVSSSPTDKLFTVSFVNGIWTQSGKHVDGLVNQITNSLVEYLETKKKTKVRPGLVKDHLAVFVECLVENPSFSSQTKEVLTSSAPCKLSDDFLKKIATKLPIVERILEAQSAKDTKDNSKTDGKKQNRITGIPKLDDAMHAGTGKSGECTLILTEGDSAKAMAISGLSQEQRKFYGVYPLRGKLLNVKDTADARVEQTKEIAELKKIMGLVSGKKYENMNSLRYGSIMIMTDQDYDGSHIRGLLINLFHELWHDLIKIPGFLTYMATPIVKATKGKEVKSFYNTQEYEAWRRDARGWKVKYYKGLGTSTRDEAKEYFQRLEKIRFKYGEASDASIELAFNKSQANDRKVWLKDYDPDCVIPPGLELPYEDFVHKDLIHFSYYNLERSIPSVMDGLKTSQRKILYSAFKRNLVSEIRVAQFAGYVSEHSGYHHGEASLNDAIIGMAQEYMGSNNIAWFVPAGQFGTRLEGGKDAASPRYIHTNLQPYVKSLVPPDDTCVLKFRDDDGTPVEPEWYAPVLPMLLVNGARGIGTGYSTFVPPCNPKVIETALRAWLSGEDESALKNAPLRPWVRGFKGTIDADGTVVGVYTMEKDVAVITELPVGTWSADFRETMEKWVADGEAKEFTDLSTDQDVNIRIKGVKEALLKKALSDKLKTTNMHAFNASGVIQKYATLQDILIEYADVRLGVYVKRKTALLKELRAQLPYHEQIVRFIYGQLEDEPCPDLRHATSAQCDKYLEDEEYTRIDDSYDFLLRLPFRSLTKEAINSHEASLKTLRSKIADLEAATPASLWIADLDALNSKKV